MNSLMGEKKVHLKYQQIINWEKNIRQIEQCRYYLFIYNISLKSLDTSSASIDHGYYVLYGETLQSIRLILAIELAY